MTVADYPVRMGELEVSKTSGDVLVSHGLGSCIGVALVDHGVGVAGLAHVMLPGPGDVKGRPPGTFADTGVPNLLQAIQRAGARINRTRAVLVGGAKMFGSAGSASLEIGQRNEAAVREALRAAGVHVEASETGGKGGRTVRVYVGESRITARTAGGAEEELYAAGLSGLRKVAA